MTTAGEHADRAETAAAGLVGVANDDVLAAIARHAGINITHGGVFIYDTSLDDDPDWTRKATTQGWYGEARPSGEYLGYYADAAAAVAAGGGVGDYYLSTADSRIYEITGSDPAASTMIQRAGTARFPAVSVWLGDDNTDPTEGKVVALDATTRDLAPWAWFSASGSLDAITSNGGAGRIAARNGLMAIALDGDRGLTLIDWIEQRAWRWRGPDLNYGEADGGFATVAALGGGAKLHRYRHSPARRHRLGRSPLGRPARLP